MITRNWKLLIYEIARGKTKHLIGKQVLVETDVLLIYQVKSSNDLTLL